MKKEPFSADESYYVGFVDENGVENRFEILAELTYEGRDYAVMLPEEGSPSENGLLYVFEVVEELDSDTDTYVGVADQDVIDAVYDLFCSALDEADAE